ncbi:MAG: UDP-N-acetylmuramoyl-tripeptide--D-alanyl-D-alanine ligase [Legionellales bacterium]|nr:UDP-N-acetylmuramoyl-tripeptide--D-alanyl-D-alanine ligase [Legionellales bacterium]|tara:strand:+ start:14083 stop:15438 length:1356 start_codon:yes stop_codon:yes gene_type:complete
MIYLSKLAQQLQGKHQGVDVKVQRASIDTRTLDAGDIFFAITGPNFNGHEFIQAAKDNGAVAAVVSEPVETDLPTITVSDVRKALGQYAKYHARHTDIPKIAITGSCGKTTTKSMLASILSEAGNVCATKGTLNNDLGLPLTVLNITADHDFAVLEMGANAHGEIAGLCEIAPPDVAVITNVHPVHLEGFGDIAGVAKAKSEIYTGLKDTGIAVINIDSQYADYWQRLIPGRSVMTFGMANDAEVRADNVVIDGTGCASFDIVCGIEKTSVHLPILGEHNVMNALTAAACAIAINIPLNKIKSGLEKTTAVSKRLNKHTLTNGALIIDDTYNANPASFLEALKVLAEHKGHKVVVAGDMAELGDETEKYHRDLGRQLKQQGVDAVYGYGELIRNTVDAFGEGANHYISKAQLAMALQAAITPDTVVLVKGSRSMQMEIIVEALLQEKSHAC